MQGARRRVAELDAPHHGCPVFAPFDAASGRLDAGVLRRDCRRRRERGRRFAGLRRADAREVVARITAIGDLFAPVLTTEQTLPSTQGRLRQGRAPGRATPIFRKGIVQSAPAPR